MKIMYLTHRNARDKREWSGTMYYMGEALAKHAGKIVYAGPYQPRLLIIFLKIINKLSLIILRKRYNIPYSYLLAMKYRFWFTRRIKKEKPDVIIAVSSSGEMSLLKVDCPIIYVGDITLELLIDSYPNFTNLSRFSLWESEIIERSTFKNSAALVFSSDWAANSARDHYKTPEEKIHVIPYGANMDRIPEGEEVTSKRIGKPLKILFLGVDWIRKGGDIVYQSFLEIRQAGVPVELTICGCVPPVNDKDENLKVIPFLNKNKEEDAQILYNILLASNFLFVPSRSDCTPIAFSEANSFGIPVITSNVGGIPSIVKDGLNGHTLPLESKSTEYTEIILNYCREPEKYSELVRNSRLYYESFLNWDFWGLQMKELCQQLTGKQ